MKTYGVVAASVVGLSFVAVAACGGSTTSAPGGGGDGGAPPASGLTYFHDVKPIVDAKCAGCHTQGGIGPFALDTADGAVAHAAAMANAVTTHLMPPWMPAPGCQTYLGDLSLADAQISTIADWAKGGAAPGDPSNAGAPLPPGTSLSRVDRTLTMPASYTPALHPDEYRCFVVDWTETTTKFVTGFRARAGNAAIVHHVIAYLAQPSEAAAYKAMDTGTGYTCFGGPGGGGRQEWVGAWAPGSAGFDSPAGTGIRIDPGSKIVLQVHYNTLNSTGSDQTSIDFKLDDKVTKEAIIAPYTDPKWVQGGMSIAAGDPNATYKLSLDVTPYMNYIAPGLIANNSPFLIYSTGLHMHMLGTTIATSITRAGGGADTCLLDIPAWNFHWQGSYQLEKPVTFNPGDKLNLECHWDNSAAHQVVVNGQKLAPHNVNWGEGSTDEMCLGVMYITAP